jgi:hypothetical protein
MRFERRFVTPKSPSESLRLIADFRNLKEWDDSVVSVKPMDSSFGQGSRFLVEVLFSGNLIEIEYTVTVYEPGIRAELSGTAAKATATDVIEVSRVSDGTQVDYIAEIRLAFPFSIFDPLLAIGFKKTVDHAVSGLTRFLSAQ